jgi:AcrR family transcriptional regulator
MNATIHSEATLDDSRRWRRKPEARSEEVLDAALDLFIAKGFASTRMEDIAVAAGLSKAAIYLYFSSKDAVFIALVRTRLVPIRTRFLEAAMSAGGDPVAGLKAVALAWTAVMSDQRLAALPLIVMGEAARFPDVVRYYHEEVTERVLSIISDLYRSGIETGQFRAIDPRSAARALIAPLVLDVWRRQAFAWLEPTPKPPESVAEEVFDVFFNGAAARPIHSDNQL